MEKQKTKNIASGDESKRNEEVWFSSLAADDTYLYDVDRAFDRFRSRFGLNKPARLLSSKWVYAAASVAILLCVSLTSFWQGGRHIKSNFADIIVEAPLGSKSKLMLPDGTMVWLNAGSRLVYSQAFGIDNRNLELQGEAYFEVVKRSGMSLKVQSRELNIEVLGTKFNVRNYEQEREVVVDLLEGKVALENRLEQMELCFLKPSEKLVLDKQTGEMTVLKSRVQHARAWTDDILFFDEDLLVDIARELERSYDVKILIPDPSLQMFRFYGSFNKRKQNIKDVLDVMSLTDRLRYEITDDNVILIEPKQ